MPPALPPPALPPPALMPASRAARQLNKGSRRRGSATASEARRASNWRSSWAGLSVWSRTVKAGGRSDAGSPGARHHCPGRPGRLRRASAVRASQASRPSSATAAAAAAKTPGSQKRVPSTRAYARGSGAQADRSACTRVIRWPSPRRPASSPSSRRASSETSTAVTRRPFAAASRAAPDGPQARSATGPSGRSRASARAASGWARKDGSKPDAYLAFHLARSG